MQVLTELREIKKQLASGNALDLLTNDELMLQYKVSRSTCQTWRNQGLAHSKKGSKLYYRREDIEQFLMRTRRKGF